MIKGIDISKWQGKPNFDLVRTATEFIILKASEGVGYKDPEFDRNRSEAKRVGLLIGYYHFARPDLGNSPEAEVEWFSKVIGTPEPGAVLVLDIEVPHNDLVGWSKRFLENLSGRLGGYKPLIYLNKSQIVGNNWKSVIDQNYGVWVAYYDNNPGGLPFAIPWPTLAIKQYTSQGRVPGISGNVDMNTFFGTQDAYKRYGYNPPVPTPQPIPQPPVNDQTKINIGKSPLGTDYGVMEVQAVRSTIFDQEKNLKEKRDTLKKIADLAIS